jgi:hypothetical protein
LFANKRDRYRGLRVRSEWAAHIARQYPGRFARPEEAARAYDRAAVERFGEFATLIFPPSALSDRERPR